jgi:hypothetical protein
MSGFVSYLSIVFGSEAIYMARDSWIIFGVISKNSSLFPFYGYFRNLLPIIF